MIASKLVFFYCTIPFVLAATSAYATLQHRRGAALPLAIVLGAVGLLAWLIQVALQGKCMFEGGDLDLLYVQKSPGFCGFALTDTWRPSSTWQTGLGVVMAMTWTSLLMLLL
jgi:hypothetical protein